MKTQIKPLTNGRLIISGGGQFLGDVVMSAAEGETVQAVIDWESWLDGETLTTPTAISDPDNPIEGTVTIATTDSVSTVSITAPPDCSENGWIKVEASTDANRKQVIRLRFGSHSMRRDYDRLAYG